LVLRDWGEYNAAKKLLELVHDSVAESETAYFSPFFKTKTDKKQAVFAISRKS
jgi:hypothetical protein